MIRKTFSRIALILTSFALVFVAIMLILNKQYVIDQITVWRYSPSDSIKSLIDRTGMSDYGKFIFYASQPQLQSSADFNQSCARIEETSSVLGCYDGDKIYIYDIKNSQLEGIREVTAAHEALHAVYNRLNDVDKTRINTLLEDEYKKLESNKNFTDRMSFYARTEPGQRGNELHSIIGTEISSISTELESYYDKYFSDRQQIVDLNAKYISIFQDLENKANTLKAQLDSLKISVDNQTNQYNTDIQILNNDISEFNSKANNGLFFSQAEFNYERNIILNRVNILNNMKDKINSDIENYNLLLVQLNSIASESQQLHNSIDSTLSPVPSI